MTVKKGFGPGFLEAGSRLYRAEYGAISVAILGYLVWRGLFAGGVDVLQTVFWALFADLVAFMPIGVSSKRREWPNWGVFLYDAVHNVITWGLAFIAVWIIFRVPSWPMFGWLGHITVDRTVGYGLRKLPSSSSVNKPRTTTNDASLKIRMILPFGKAVVEFWNNTVTQTASR